MAFNYPNITSSDALDTWLNGFLAKIKTVINAFPGSQLVASSVTVDKLSKPKARFSLCFSYGPGALVNASVANIFSRTMLNSDGAAAAYQIVGWSVSVNNYAGSAALTKSVSATLTFHKNGGGAFLTIDISTAAATLAVGTPISADLSGAPLSLAQGDVVTVNYNWATTAGASYPGLEVVLDVTLAHAGT